MDNTHILSVCVITYNQEKYIEQALQSILKQKTNFSFQIIISDDCSTDNTAQIIKKYAQMYPDKINAFFQEKNLGSTKNFIFCLSQAKTKYVIINEGDDYFISEDKLQKQVDFLETHPEYSICFHRGKTVFEDSAESDLLQPIKKLIRKGTTFNQLLKMNYIKTNTALYRWRFIDKNVKDYFPDNIFPCDWYLHLLHAKVGKIAILKEAMSVYRVHKNGIWAGKSPDEITLRFGERLLNFYFSVWTNITDESDDYFKNILLPYFKDTMEIYYKNGNFKELENIKKTYPEIYEKAYNVPAYSERKTAKHLKNTLIALKAVSAVLFITLILLIIFIIY